MTPLSLPLIVLLALSAFAPAVRGDSPPYPPSGTTEPELEDVAACVATQAPSTKWSLPWSPAAASWSNDVAEFMGCVDATAIGLSTTVDTRVEDFIANMTTFCAAACYEWSAEQAAGSSTTTLAPSTANNSTASAGIVTMIALANTSTDVLRPWQTTPKPFIQFSIVSRPRDHDATTSVTSPSSASPTPVPPPVASISSSPTGSNDSTRGNTPAYIRIPTSYIGGPQRSGSSLPFCACLAPAFYVASTAPKSSSASSAAASAFNATSVCSGGLLPVVQATLKCPAMPTTSSSSSGSSATCGVTAAIQSACRVFTGVARSPLNASRTLTCCRPAALSDDANDNEDNFSLYRNIVQYMIVVIIVLAVLEGCVYGVCRYRRNRQEEEDEARADALLARLTDVPAPPANTPHRHRVVAGLLADHLMETVPTTTVAGLVHAVEMSQAAAAAGGGSGGLSLPHGDGAAATEVGGSLLVDPLALGLEVGGGATGITPMTGPIRVYVDNPAQPCPICLDALGHVPVAALPCGHLLHAACMRDYVAHKLREGNIVPCPTCRHDVFNNMNME